MSRILKRWGIIDGLAGEAIVIKDVTLRRYANDTELTRVSLPNVDCIKDSTMLSVHRGDLQLAMKNAAEAAGAEINLASGVEDIDFENTRFKIKGHSNWIQKDVIIAADGLKSIVRTKILALHGDTEKVKQTGDGVSRIVISAEQIYNSNDAELIELLESPTQFRWIGPGGQIVCYPVCNHKILYVGLGHPQKEDTEELWITKRDKKELLDYYGIWHTRAKKLLDYLPDGEVLEWKVHDHKDLPRWIENKVALMGDAAHPMLPYTAQGAAQAIEDAVVLSVCLSMIDSREQVDLALKVYQLVRKPRASILQRSTAQLQKTLHLHDGPEQQSRDEKMFNAIKTGSNPDVFSDTSFQNWCWVDIIVFFHIIITIIIILLYRVPILSKKQWICGISY